MPDVPLLESRFVVLEAKPRYICMCEDAGMLIVLTHVVNFPDELLSIQEGITFL